ncbi:MAG TPA: hypothetical protein VJK51_02915 [Candidatus Nanoarchaeia archaeon]|nr:hypothetical protein [Candidatus Nanoarchaeia archaeon]
MPYQFSEERELAQLIDAPTNPQDQHRDINRISGAIHARIWANVPQRIYVKEYTIPLLERAHKMVLECARSDSSLQYIAETQERRIKNLYRYSRGEPSDFISDESRKRIELS